MSDATNGHTASHLYKEKLEAFRKSDAERDIFIQDVLRKCEELEEQLRNKSDDFENELAGQRLWQAQARRYQSDLRGAHLASETKPFVLVVIDGDGAFFHDRLYRATNGGAEAAHNLCVDIKAYVAQLDPEASMSNWSIMLHYYYDMEGLSHKLRSTGVIPTPNHVASFARAFGLNQPLFNCIDVGSDKEITDYKVRDTLNLFLRNSQCKHVIFGGCHDTRYLPALDPHKRDLKVASHITLLETLPMQSGFVELGFKTISFPSVSRSEELPQKPAAKTSTLPQRSATSGGVSSYPSSIQCGMQGESTPSNSKPTSPNPSIESPASSWATVGKASAGQKQINIAPKRTAARKFILLNNYEERLDLDMAKADAGSVSRLFERTKKHKVCNNYHLKGTCEAGKYCDYDHGERLSAGEQIALKHRARTRSCPLKSACRDFDCTNGHICPYGDSCYNDNCWFQDLHGVDLEPAIRIYENGEADRLKNP